MVLNSKVKVSEDYLQNQIIQYKKELKWIQNELDDLKFHRSKLSILGEMSNSLHFDLKTSLQDLILALEVLKELSKNNLTDDVPKEYSRIEKIVLEMVNKINETNHFINKKPTVLHKISLKEIIEIIKKDIEIPSGIELNRTSNCSIICDPQLIILAFTVLITHLIQKLNGQGKVLINVREYDDISEIVLKIPGNSFSDDEMIKLFDPFKDQHLCCSNVSLESVKEIIECHRGMIQLKNNPTRVVLKFLQTSKEEF